MNATKRDLHPCPLCASDQIKLRWSASGVGGQMITVTAFAECECCLTVFRGAASSTAGFSLRDAHRQWQELPENMAHMRRHNERDRAAQALSASKETK